MSLMTCVRFLVMDTNIRFVSFSFSFVVCRFSNAVSFFSVPLKDFAECG